MTDVAHAIRVIAKLEQELGVPQHWYSTLLGTQDEWSFVIKLHAVFEAALTQMLEVEVVKPGLRRFVAAMNMGGQFGKLRLAEELALMDKDQVRLIRVLSGIRNDCIHDIRNVTFTFKKYFEDLTANREREILAAFKSFFADRVGRGQSEISRNDFVRRSTKTAFWIAGTRVLAEIYKKKALADQVDHANREALPALLMERTFSEIFGNGRSAKRPALLRKE